MPQLAIIIPTLNEERYIERTLLATKAAAPEAEIIVVDGGSRDATVTKARQYVSVIQAKRGRGGQLNAGVAATQGEILLFLCLCASLARCKKRQREYKGWSDMADEHVSTSTNSDRFLPQLKQRQHSGIQTASTGNEEGIIIWTPTFIALFALTLVVGLSLTTILIQGWLNGHYSDKSVLLASMPLLFCAWIAMLIKARSTWVRAGAIFGSFWSLFTAGNFWLLVVDPQSASVIQINIAADSALLGTFICLSLAHAQFRLWDTWFFRLLPLLAIIILGASYLHNIKEVDALYRVESTGGTLLLYLCSAVWLLRPSCWHNQPGPAFLFGIAPLTLLLFVMSDNVGREQIFFFQQIFLLYILLGALRILQGELRRSLPGSML